MNGQNAAVRTHTTDRLSPRLARESTIRYCLILLQLFLIAAIVYLFRIEQQRHFLPTLCYISVGFAIHFWLPIDHRQPFFAALSVGSVLFVMGAINGFYVLAISGVCISICYLPVSMRIQMVLLATLGIALVAFRSLYSWPFWPVLGSILMFRLLIFAREHWKHQSTSRFSSVVSYFFMVPNVCFPFFPVVDFKTFHTSWYNDDEWKIYQRGIVWIVRGITHLLLYRLIRVNLVPDPDNLQSFQQIAIFAATNYALYLQVSGQFHLITGLLHLFGFNLPRTHRHFFFASSFSDIWRRINIYWKDFMSKMFFFPAFFFLRQRGSAAGLAIALSVFWVFVCTWLLHSWQTFWLMGRFPITLNDACLWLGAGTCVAINAVYDSRRGQRTAPGPWLFALSLSVRTVSMFVLVSLFWACWTKPAFLNAVRDVASNSESRSGLMTVLFVLFGAMAVGMFLIYFYRVRNKPASATRELDFYHSVKLHASGMAVLLALTQVTTENLPDATFSKFLSNLRTNRVAAHEVQLRGYYEDLNTAVIQAGPLLQSISSDAELQRVQAEGFEKISRPADRYQSLELIPGMTADLNGSAISINQFGMRDRSTLTMAKPPDTTRIAIVGSSIVMGYGVTDEQVFGRVFETLLNDSRPQQQKHIDVLNFGVGKQWAPHRLIRIQRQVVQFSPDMLIYVAHQDEFSELAAYTGMLIADRMQLPSKHFDDVAAKAGVVPEMPPGEIYSRLMQAQPGLLSAVYQTIVDECRDHRIQPIWIYMPIPDPNSAAIGSQLIPIAKAAGFDVYDLSDWHQDQDGLFPAPGDHHPTAKGHKLIAESLLELFRQHSSILSE
ncbi:MAG: SGNH/GDSL hydrolase family protein [Planctomycetaceae bacterium]|nr:SGNH/GDSL hydrolase family protein [Planctomycetaceae bacterium]